MTTDWKGPITKDKSPSANHRLRLYFERVGRVCIPRSGPDPSAKCVTMPLTLPRCACRSRRRRRAEGRPSAMANLMATNINMTEF